MNTIFRFFKKLKETKKRNEAFRKEYKERTGKDFDTQGYGSESTDSVNIPWY
jgi:hypothetical protein